MERYERENVAERLPKRLFHAPIYGRTETESSSISVPL